MTEFVDVPRVSALRSTIRLVAFALAFAITYVVAVLLPAGQELDSSSFSTITVGNLAFALMNDYRETVPIVMLVACFALGVVALVRRRIAVVAVAVAIVVGSVLLAEGFKLVLPRPDLGPYGYPQNTFPSGHVALAVSSALALSVLMPLGRWHRPVIALAGAAAIGVTWASIVSLAHRPSDVVGGSLVVGMVAAAVLFTRRTSADVHPRVLVALACAAGLGVALVVFGALLGGAGSLVGTSAGSLGWFLLCASPAAFVIGFVPTQSREGLPERV